MSARPLPYSDASSMTKVFVDLTVSLMYLAAAGPCVASLPRARKKVFQPLSASFGLVADGVMVTRPASLKAGAAAFDSPEKPGPTMPAVLLSSMAFLARVGACVGSP